MKCCHSDVSCVVGPLPFAKLTTCTGIFAPTRELEIITGRCLNCRLKLVSFGYQTVMCLLKRTGSECIQVVTQQPMDRGEGQRKHGYEHQGHKIVFADISPDALDVLLCSAGSPSPCKAQGEEPRANYL